MKILKIILISIILILLCVVYFFYDPSQYSFFPKCPLLNYTGIQCPGCGSQRALHDLFNLNFSGAIQHNFLMVLSIPYIIGGYYFELKKKWSSKEEKIRNTLYSTKAIWTVFVVVIVFWIGRNVV